MKSLVVSLALALVAIPAFGEVMFGDEVVSCIMNTGTKAGDPDFDPVMRYCEKKVESDRLARVPSEEDQQKAYVNCLIKRHVNPPEIPKEDSVACLISSGIPDPGEDARNLGRQNWLDCLVTQTVRLDDGISPVSDVSRAILGLCKSEWKDLVNALWLPPETKRLISSSAEKYAVEEGARAVLLARKTQQKRHTKLNK